MESIRPMHSTIVHLSLSIYIYIGKESLDNDYLKIFDNGSSNEYEKNLKKRKNNL
jgi:hypothetical protein